jgi:hypothetical protein
MSRRPIEAATSPLPASRIDVCLYPEEQEPVMRALKAAGVPARRITGSSRNE